MQVWFSPHGTEWNAETYEEALEMERDALVEQLQAADVALDWIAQNHRRVIVEMPNQIFQALRRASVSSPAIIPDPEELGPHDHIPLVSDGEES